MDVTTEGAWLIHHTDKLRQVRDTASFGKILVAGTSGILLSALAATDESELPLVRVQALAQANGINLLEVDSVLSRLEQNYLIQRDSENVHVIGVTTAAVLTHTTKIFHDLQPTESENAAIALAELVSHRPLVRQIAGERICDEFRLSSDTVSDLLLESRQIGFVDVEGDGTDALYFNGHLFRRDGIVKTQRVLDSLNSDDRSRIQVLEQQLGEKGCMPLSQVDQILSTPLREKLNAIGLFDIHGVENEYGTTFFVTKPSAFAKFTDSFHDDALDMAKALVACFTYGMTQRNPAEGRIRMPAVLIGKLVQGLEIGGRAPAIGRDYQALEYKGVLKVRREGANYFMRLLKRDIGELALRVLTTGDASQEVLPSLPSAVVNRYIAPEQRRSDNRQMLRKRNDNKQTGRSIQNMLRALREQ